MGASKLLSTVTLVLTSLFMLGLAAGLLSGGIFDACHQYAVVGGVTHAECQAFFAGALGKKPTEVAKTMVALALVFPRIEAALFLALGAGGAYTLATRAKGTPEVALIHAIQGIFFFCAACIHAHNSDYLPFAMDPNMVVGGAPFAPFIGVTGLLGVLCWSSCILSLSPSRPADSSPVFEHMKQIEEVKAKEAASVKLQAALRGKAVREEDAMRKRRSSIGTADI